MKLLALLLLLAAPAQAQDGTLQLEQFESQLTESGVLGQPVASVLPRHSLSLELHGWYLHKPLALIPDDDGFVKLYPVVGRLAGSFHAGYGIAGWAQVDVAVPWSSPIGTPEAGWAGYTADELGAHALGDIRVSGQVDITKAIWGKRRFTAGFGLGAGGTLWIPTGDDAALSGERLPRGDLRVSGDWTAPFGLRIGGTAGFVLRETSTLFEYRNGPRLRWGATLTVPLVVRPVEAVATVFGSVPLEPLDVSSATTPVEFLAGVRYIAPFGLRLQLAGGAGLTGGVGAPQFRVVGQVGWNIPLPEPIRPVPDDDDDGVPNDVDRCPLEPELVNAIRDADGCPEANLVQDEISTSDPGTDVSEESVYEPADIAALPPLAPENAPPPEDGDSLEPHEDVCPGEPEDIDGFEDEDGCPDPDNDQDLVLDVDDLCPLVAESPNGLRDDDGCPEPIWEIAEEPTGPDTDGDGVIDSRDRCPNELETINGVRDYDGCPEDPRALEIEGDQQPFGSEGQPSLAERLPQNGDADGDGVADLSDECPLEREDRDGFQDWDGCPDPDNDNDGVIDRVDRCPLDAENINGVIDMDGCPDMGWVGIPAPVGSEVTTSTDDAEAADTNVAWLPPLPRGGDIDGDGMDYLVDQCPNEPEDVDGVLDLDGCPDLDDDGDGFADADDRCPLEAETFNGFEDDDGCADAIPTKLIDVTGVVRGIQFRSGSARLLRSSYAILNNVVEALESEPTLALEILGHTDSQGDRQKNLDLSLARAEAVSAWLQKKGVASERLSVTGLGPDQPLATNDTDEGRAENRRVELKYSRTETSP